MLNVIRGISIPFLGTVLGAACVFFMRGEINKSLQRALSGFAAGVMTAASVWSLLIPAMQQAKELGKFSFFPAACGFWVGVLFLLALDRLIPHIHLGGDVAEGPKNRMKKTSLLVLAVVLHNLPEGMAVGVVFAGVLNGSVVMSSAGALALAIGIAIQNFPEGAIISMPLASAGESKPKAFVYGALSGIVEPLGAILTILAASAVTPILPYVLGFAAGAMIYVVVDELIPEMAEGEHTNLGILMFSFGFTLMMILDIALG